MNLAHLNIQLPNKASEFFIEDSNGEMGFTWSNFDNKNQIKLKLSPKKQNTQEEFYYKAGVPKCLHKNEYLPLIDKTINAIKTNEWGKVVISRAKYAEKIIEPLTLYRKLCSAYPKLTVYLFSHPKVGTWCGATPETLLKIEGKKLHTMSLAGTMPLENENGFGPKEYHEQDLVTQFIERILREESGLKNVKIGPVELSHAAKVVHLKSEITADAAGRFDSKQLLNKLHPTPAVCGLPRKESLDFIRNNEGYEREAYSGYFGLNTKNKAHFWVNLRCLQFFKDGYALYAGGGITKDSNAQKEWQETQEKMNTLLSIINA